MAPKIKEALGWMSEASETACGWGLIAVAAYAWLFTDLTGNGRLWDAMRGVAQEATDIAPNHKNVAIRMRKVPVRPPDLLVKEQNHMLMVPEAPEKEFVVPVVATPAQPRMDQPLTDAPSDGNKGKDWRVHLMGELRRFTVYGRGEETSSASATVGSAPTASAAARPAAATESTPESAYRSGVAAAARPGISNHVSRPSAAPDSVRNFR